MSEEVRKLFRIKGRSADQSSTQSTPVGPASTAASKRNIFQQCINYRRSSSSSSSPTLPNHHHHHHHQHDVQSTSANQGALSLTCVECRKAKPMEPPLPPKLPPRPATVACSGPRTSSSSAAMVPQTGPVQATAEFGPSSRTGQEPIARPNSVPPLATLSSLSLQSSDSERCDPEPDKVNLANANIPTSDPSSKLSKPQLDESSKHTHGKDASLHRTPPAGVSVLSSGRSLMVKEADTHRRSPSRSQSSLSSLEPISQGVDTLEVCDKAAARLRELANHLEHGDIPNSVLQKTLQYAAVVLDSISMEEARRPKLNKQPLRPSPSPQPEPMPPSNSSVAVSQDAVLVASVVPASTTTDSSAKAALPLAARPAAASSLFSSSTSSSSSSSSKGTCISKSAQTKDSVKRVILTQVDPKADQTLDETGNSRIDTTTQDSLQRRLLDEEDELAEVQPDAVPNEVREWLASTFTRSQVAPKPRSDDKPKFRSVANAIRAGIMVDRIYRRLFNATSIHIPAEVSTFLRAVDEWSFDVFAMNSLCPSKVLRNLSAELLNRYGLVHKFKIPSNSLDSFLCQIEQGYMKYSNPYHNNLHAADVTQTVHYMLWVTGLAQWLTDLEVFAVLIAAVIHDYQHTGTTNNFHINSNSEITLMYNDRSVLENYHISEAFKVMRREESNIILNLSREEYREFRTLIIEMVIATDMSTHFQQVKTLKTLLSHQEFSVDKQKGLSYILHSADISHPSKVFPLHQRWTLLLMEEFFRQGDMEKELGLAYSPLCDRNSTLIPQSQIGFIDFIVAPTMELCGDLIERVHEHINAQQHQAEVADSADDQVAEIANEAKAQPRSQSSTDSSTKPTAASKANGSGPSASRNTSSAPAYTRCSAPVILFKKLHRPWLKHLEENKNLWQLKAAEEAKQMADEQTADLSDDD